MFPPGRIQTHLEMSPGVVSEECLEVLATYSTAIRPAAIAATSQVEDSKTKLVAANGLRCLLCYSLEGALLHVHRI